MAGPSIRGCSPEEEQKLRLALQAARARLTGGVCGLTGLDELRRAALVRLGGSRPLTIYCSECEGIPAAGFTPMRPNGELSLCRRLFSTPQERIAAVLFHELVHVCGGSELDGEGLECHCFGQGGATLPTRSDYQVFRRLPARNGYYLAKYLMWHPATGGVFVRGPGGDPGPALSVRFLPTRR